MLYIVVFIYLCQAQYRTLGWDGATYLVTKASLDAGQHQWSEVVGPPAVSVTTRQIFDTISADTVIIKIDVEGHECKVTLKYIQRISMILKALTPDILDQSTGKYVPYIFMECRPLSPYC